MTEKQTTGRKKFYQYFCEKDPNHTQIKYKNRPVCKECTESTSKRVYMKKKCLHCGKIMNNNSKHFYECPVYNKTDKKKEIPSTTSTTLKQQTLRYQTPRLRPIHQKTLESMRQNNPFSAQNVIMNYINYYNPADHSFYLMYTGQIPQPIPPTIVPPIVEESHLQCRFEQVKKLLQDPHQLDQASNMLEDMIKYAKWLRGQRSMNVIIMEAVLSCALWVKGECQRGQMLLKYCIKEAEEQMDMEHQLLWTRWLSVRDIQRGAFKEAENALKPIILEYKKLYKDSRFPTSNESKATFYNNYAMSLAGQGLEENDFEKCLEAENYFNDAITLNGNQPIYIHNLSDLYKNMARLKPNQKDDYLSRAKFNSSQVIVDLNQLPIYRVLFLNNFADILKYEENYIEALKHIQIAKTILEHYKLFYHPAHARILETEASIHACLQNWLFAENCIHEAIKIGEEKMKESGTHHLQRFYKLKETIALQKFLEESNPNNIEEELLSVEDLQDLFE